MPDLDKLSAEELLRPETLKRIEENVNFVIFNYDEEEALKLSRQLRKILERKNLEVNREFISKLKKQYNLVSYISLPAQIDVAILSLFQNSFIDILILDDEILIDRLGTFLWVQPLGVREELAEKLIQALRDNKETLGDLTLGEWIAIFVHSYLGRLQLLAFEERDFLNKNEKAQKLSDGDKVKLARLLMIYDALRPFEIRAQYFRERGEEVTREEKEQIALGRAMEKVGRETLPATPQGYQGPQDLRDIRPQGGVIRRPWMKEGLNNKIVQGAPTPPPPLKRPEPLRFQKPFSPPATTQEIKTPPAEPVSPPPREKTPPIPPHPPTPPSSPKPTPSSAESSSIPEEPGEITIAHLEKVAAANDPVEEKRLREIIRQDFNKLSSEMRRYILNSPFWAE